MVGPLVFTSRSSLVPMTGGHRIKGGQHGFRRRLDVCTRQIVVRTLKWPLQYNQKKQFSRREACRSKGSLRDPS